MAAVSESIVREYFELHGFFVRQQRKFIAPSRREDEEIDFFILRPQPELVTTPVPFILTSADLRSIARGVVVVKGWHTESFSPAVLANAPEIFRFVEPAAFQRAVRAFGGAGTPTKILVVPALPQAEGAKAASVGLLRSKGVDAVIPFQTMLMDLIDQIEVNRNYQKSDLLQIIRILKNYDFFREQQLELFKGKRARARKAGAASPPPEGEAPPGR
jgi:hypothetical protein